MDNPVKSLMEASQQKNDDEVKKKFTEAVEAMEEQKLAENIFTFHFKFIDNAKVVRLRTAQGPHLQNSITRSLAAQHDIANYNGIWIKSYKGFIPDRIKKLIDGELNEEEEAINQPENA